MLGYIVTCIQRGPDFTIQEQPRIFHTYVDAEHFVKGKVKSFEGLDSEIILDDAGAIKEAYVIIGFEKFIQWNVFIIVD